MKKIIITLYILTHLISCKTNYQTIDEPNVFNSSLKEEMKKTVLYDFYDGDSSKIDFTKYPFN